MVRGSIFACSCTLSNPFLNPYSSIFCCFCRAITGEVCFMGEDPRNPNFPPLLFVNIQLFLPEEQSLPVIAQTATTGESCCFRDVAKTALEGCYFQIMTPLATLVPFGVSLDYQSSPVTSHKSQNTSLLFSTLRHFHPSPTPADRGTPHRCTLRGDSPQQHFQSSPESA